MGPYKPLRNWVDDVPIPYYMDIMGVDRPDRTFNYLVSLDNWDVHGS